MKEPSDWENPIKASEIIRPEYKEIKAERYRAEYYADRCNEILRKKFKTLPVVMGEKYEKSFNAIGGWHTGSLSEHDTHTARLFL